MYLALGQTPRTGWLDGFAVPAPAQVLTGQDAIRWQVPSVKPKREGVIIRYESEN